MKSYSSQFSRMYLSSSKSYRRRSRSSRQSSKSRSSTETPINSSVSEEFIFLAILFVFLMLMQFRSVKPPDPPYAIESLNSLEEKIRALRISIEERSKDGQSLFVQTNDNKLNLRNEAIEKEPKPEVIYYESELSKLGRAMKSANFDNHSQLRPECKNNEMLENFNSSRVYDQSPLKSFLTQKASFDAPNPTNANHMTQLDHNTRPSENTENSAANSLTLLLKKLDEHTIALAFDLERLREKREKRNALHSQVMLNDISKKKENIPIKTCHELHELPAPDEHLMIDQVFPCSSINISVPNAGKRFNGIFKQEMSGLGSKGQLYWVNIETSTYLYYYEEFEGIWVLDNDLLPGTGVLGFTPGKAPTANAKPPSFVHLDTWSIFIINWFKTVKDVQISCLK